MKIEAADQVAYLAEQIERLSQECQPLWHPLGFASCVIKEIKGHHTIRVHYWPPNQRRTKNPDWPIHTHSYHLSSFVLKGSVRDIQYEVTDGDDHYVYEVRYHQGNSEIIKTDKIASISESINTTQTARCQYHVSRGVFHQSRVDFSESAVTLVALSEFGNDPPLVLGAPGDYRYPYDRTSFDKVAFWSEVRRALASIGYESKGQG